MILSLARASLLWQHPQKPLYGKEKHGELDQDVAASFDEISNISQNSPSLRQIAQVILTVSGLNLMRAFFHFVPLPLCKAQRIDRGGL